MRKLVRDTRNDRPHLSHRNARQHRGTGGQDRQRPVDRHIRALPGETQELKARVAARVLAHPAARAERHAVVSRSADDGSFNRAEVDIGFPLEAVGTDLSALMTIAIGGIFSIKQLTGISVVDMKLARGVSRRLSRSEIRHRRQPPADRRRWTGRSSAASSSRRSACGRTKRRRWSRELVESGVDFIKDDEKLMSPAYSPFEERVKAVMPIILDHEQKTGKKVMYAFGISHADPDEMMRNHDLVLEAGGNAAVVNINSVGMGGMAFLRKRSRPRHPRPPQRLGHPDPPSRARHGLQGLAAVLAAARRRSVPDQRHRRQILGAGRMLRRLRSRR